MHPLPLPSMQLPSMQLLDDLPAELLHLILEFLCVRSRASLALTSTDLLKHSLHQARLFLPLAVSSEAPFFEETVASFSRVHVHSLEIHFADLVFSYRRRWSLAGLGQREFFQRYSRVTCNRVRLHIRWGARFEWLPELGEFVSAIVEAGNVASAVPGEASCGWPLPHLAVRGGDHSEKAHPIHQGATLDSPSHANAAATVSLFSYHMKYAMAVPAVASELRRLFPPMAPGICACEWSLDSERSTAPQKLTAEELAGLRSLQDHGFPLILNAFQASALVTNAPTSSSACALEAGELKRLFEHHWGIALHDVRFPSGLHVFPQLPRDQDKMDEDRTVCIGALAGEVAPLVHVHAQTPRWQMGLPMPPCPAVRLSLHGVTFARLHVSVESASSPRERVRAQAGNDMDKERERRQREEDGGDGGVSPTVDVIDAEMLERLQLSGGSASLLLDALSRCGSQCHRLTSIVLSCVGSTGVVTVGSLPFLQSLAVEQFVGDGIHLRLQDLPCLRFLKVPKSGGCGGIRPVCFESDDCRLRPILSRPGDGSEGVDVSDGGFIFADLTGDVFGDIWWQFAACVSLSAVGAVDRPKILLRLDSHQSLEDIEEEHLWVGGYPQGCGGTFSYHDCPVYLLRSLASTETGGVVEGKGRLSLQPTILVDRIQSSRRSATTC